MKKLCNVLATAVILTFATQTYVANAATKVVKHGTITMKQGNRTGLQEIYSWDDQCRTVRVRVKPRKSSRGKVFVVRDRFVISKKQSRQCAGKTVSGYRVVFKALRKGDTTAEYSIRSKNLPQTYVVRRKMQIN